MKKAFKYVKRMLPLFCAVENLHNGCLYITERFGIISVFGGRGTNSQGGNENEDGFPSLVSL